MGSGLIGVLEQRGLWTAYRDQVAGLEPVLLDMSRRGMPVDRVSYGEVMTLLTSKMAEAKQRMQELVPAEVKEWTTYKRGPKVVTAAHFQVDAPLADGSMGKQWRKWKVWSPSNKGLIAYIKHRKHPVPMNMKGDKETTAALEVMRLSRTTKDPLYAQVIAYRKAQTVLKNHMKNWLPGDDDRVHSTFYFDPATAQLSSRRPNVQNAPKRNDPEFGGYADVFRSMIKAREGHVVLEFDFKSFHAQTLAFEAQDADYLRLAKLDIHSYLAARLVREPRSSVCLSWPDDQLAEYLAWIKKNHKFVRDEKAKRAILGYGFGMGAKRLYNMNRESFDNLRDATRTVDMLNASFPVCKAWRDTVRLQAHEQGCLISRFGYIRWFWEVCKWNGRAFVPGGDDSEAAIAFLPANDAFGHMRHVMLELERLGLNERYHLINNVHDSLVFECAENLIDEAMQVKRIMERPSLVLVNSICPNGLSVEVDVQAGPNWSIMKGLK